MFSSNTVHNKKQFDIPDTICREMVSRGEKAMVNCFPASGQGYAVTVLTESGEMFEGVSYNSDTYTLTMHSEATALAHAAIHGHKNIIAITGPNCHICKQLIYESSLRSGIDVMIIMIENDTIKKVPISELMPYPWPESL